MKKILICMFCSFMLNSCISVQVEKHRYSRGFNISIVSLHRVKARVPGKNENRNITLEPMKNINTFCASPSEAPVFLCENNLPGQPVINARANYSERKLIVALTRNDLETSLQRAKANRGKMPALQKVSETQHKQKQKDFLFLLGTGIFTFLSCSLFKPFLSRTKKIAYWAKANTIKTKFALAAIQTTLITGGIFAGKQLFDNDIFTTDLTTYSLMTATAAAAFLKPVKNMICDSEKRKYKKQKFHLFTVGLLSFLLFVNIGNRTAADRNFSRPVSKLMFWNEKNEVVTKTSNIQSQTLNAKPDKKAGRMALKIGLTILTSILCLALVCIGAALCCELVCVGEEGLAILLALGVVGLVISIMVIALDGIWGKGIFKKEPSSAPGNIP